jgi:prepilin-type N-terminal cleavage/methylation domain-containing protein
LNIYYLVANKNGLTLVELMIVMVLSLLLMSAVYMAYQVQNSTSQVQHQVSALQQDLRAVMDIVAMDIRHAGADPDFGFSIQGIPGDTSGDRFLRITMDLNSDKDANDANEDIGYRLNGANLERIDYNLNATQSIAQNVLALEFTYRGKLSDGTIYAITPSGPANLPDQPGNTLNSTQADAVRYIDVSIQIETQDFDPDTGNTIARTLTRRICRRNGI